MDIKLIINGGSYKMSSKSIFQGVIPPIPTVLYNDGNLDEKGMKNLIDFLIDSEVHGLFFNGSGGEFSQMTIELRKKVAKFGVEYVNGRVPVLIGTGSPSGLEAFSLSVDAENIGADGIVVINPYYWSMSEDNLYKYYSDIANNVGIPVLLYNFPSLTGQSLTANFVNRLATDHKNIVGIKQTVEEVSLIRDMILEVKTERPDFSVFCGYDDHILHTLASGGDGSIPLTASFVPELSVGIYNAFNLRKFDKVLELHSKLSPLLQLYQIDTPFVNVAKEAIKLRGINISTEMLPPLTSLDKEKKDILASKLAMYLPDIYK